MTKQELFDLLAKVPDDATVSIMGANIRVVALSREGKGVVLDENDDSFERSEYVFLHNDFEDDEDEADESTTTTAT
jgi:hypothetical protein